MDQLGRAWGFDVATLDLAIGQEMAMEATGVQ